MYIYSYIDHINTVIISLIINFSLTQYLHGRHVLHRDMKTQNVFLTGAEMTAKLGDLGLAKYVKLDITEVYNKSETFVNHLII